MPNGTEQADSALREQARILETINRIATSLSAELDLDKLVQNVTDAGTTLSGAEFGAFFYNVTDETGEAYTLYALSGAPREAFAGFPMPRNTGVFGPTFRGEGIIRLDDVTADPRYGHNPPYRGMPEGHLPVRSYLAVPVISRSGEVIGGLFFGHSKAAMFGASTEQIMAGIAGQAAIAIDNARLFEAAQREIARRRRSEEHQALLLAELNHRVKNTLAIVQAIAQQTIRHSRDPATFQDAFEGRLRALAGAHTILTEGNWTAIGLRDLIGVALDPFGRAQAVAMDGPNAIAGPKAAVALSLVLHELATNAAKHGALSSAGGQVAIAWTPVAQAGLLRLSWQESGGPAVVPPARRGFGSKLMASSVTGDLGGAMRECFDPAGYRCEIDLRWDARSAFIHSTENETPETKP